MKNIRFIVFVLTIGTLVLSACAAGVTAAPASVGSGKVKAMPVAFVGTVESMAGDQWVISGTTVTVDPAVVRDGPFNVGDQVKVEGVLNPDGSFTVSRVEVPAPQDAATLPPFGDDNSNDVNANDNGVNANINDDNSNDDNSNALNSNDDNSNDTNLNDDNSNTANTNDDHGTNSNTNDDNSNGSGGGGHSGGNDDNSGSGKNGKGGGGNDNGGGDDNGSGGGGSDD